MNGNHTLLCIHNSVISGPAYITDYMYLDEHDASDPVLVPEDYARRQRDDRYCKLLAIQFQEAHRLEGSLP